ncbi:MAG: DUF4157 domain-containing protein [Deltaproteobacteria bacterium]|nr:DUF4157 domain-containing protein [Deltaproteobacteria bacterium]
MRRAVAPAMRDLRGQAAAVEQGEGASGASAPGRRTRAGGLQRPQRPAPRLRARGPVALPEGMRASGGAGAAGPAAKVQASAAPGATGADVAFGAEPIASAGVAGASAPLPYQDTIQASFGRHDLGNVRTASNDTAREASAALGAEAYATGDRIAFGATPDLHLAAHEAAHVVQQRGGVQLSTGVGSPGDRYEVHAEEVADLVVRGESAEAALDRFAGGRDGAATAAPGAAVQRFDSPGHVAVGDSVAGESVDVNGVLFSPGELAAIVDYVGDLDNLKRFSRTVLLQMQTLLRNGVEDTLTWNELTDGLYLEEGLTNEKHFAPGEGAQNFEATFLGAYTAALEGAAAAQEHEPGSPESKAALDAARLSLYTAEHYLGDSFSAGHQVAATNIEAAIEALLGSWKRGNLAWMAPLIAHEVFAQKADIIACYGMADPRDPGTYTPITSEALFVSLAVGGSEWLGEAGLADGMRKYVHDQLADLGVEVTSKAHTTPWVLKGDHDLGSSPETVKALQVAIAEARAKFEEWTHAAGGSASADAQALFERHRPEPTDNGAVIVEGALKAGTQSSLAFMHAMATATASSIQESMDYMVISTGGLLVKRLTDPTQPLEQPVLTPYQGSASIDPPRESYPGSRHGGSLP